MTKNQTNPKVDAYVERATRWHEEVAALRALVLDCGLTEELKWGVPCYTLDGANVVLIHVFKDYCAILFFKGALLDDPDGVLVQQSENTQAARQLRFTSAAEIRARAAAVKATIRAAIAVEKAGLKVDFKSTADFAVPDEFQARLDADHALRDAFRALTPGRQRAYLLHFGAAKLSRTREARIEKCVPLIFEGRGLKDD